MGKKISRLAKLKGYPPDELAFRLRQYAWNAADYVRLKVMRKASGGMKGNSVKTGRFFVEPRDFEQIRALYAEHAEARQALLNRADDICLGRFKLLGYPSLDFRRKGGIDWHYDPVRKVAVQKRWWQQMQDESFLNGADPKIIWELSRHQHLVTLAQAHVLSGDEQYRAEIISQLQSWMDANPPKYGVNWSSSLELSYRSISWLWAWHLCGGGTAFGELTDRFLGMLEVHADHIENNLSVYYSPNTHLSGEALGLYYMGTLLPGLKGAVRWRAIGERWLLHCVDTHVLADGGYMERAFWYHRYAADIFFHFYLLGLKNGAAPPPGLQAKILGLGRFMLCASRPDGRIPLVGDDDGGRLLPLDGMSGDDPRGFLHCMAVQFDKCDYAALSPFSEEALWLLGPGAPTAFQQLTPSVPDETVHVFRESGFAFVRSGWGPKDTYVCFDCGPHGWLNCGHAHADMLSIQVYKGSEAVIIDSGTFSYQSPWRDWFRGPEAHAVVRVNGGYPAVPATPFQWRAKPHHGSLRVLTINGIHCLRGTMDAGSWKHTRELFFFGHGLLALLDTVDVHEQSVIEARFPLAGNSWRLEGDECRCPAAAIQWDAEGECSAAFEEGWQSEGYGHRIPAAILVLRMAGNAPMTFVTLVDLTGDWHAIRRVRDGGGESFAIERRADSRLVATFRSSVAEDTVCAAFAE